MADAEEIYGRKPVYPERNYDRTYGVQPPVSQRYTERHLSPRKGRADAVTWEQNAKDLKAVHGHEHPKDGAVPVGTAKMFDGYGVGPMTFYSTKPQEFAKLAFDASGDPIPVEDKKGNLKQAEVRMKATSGEQARALEGPIHVVDPLNDATFDSAIIFDSPDLVVTRYQERQVQAADKYDDPRLLPNTWHPKTSGIVIRRGEKLRSEMS